MMNLLSTKTILLATVLAVLCLDVVAETKTVRVFVALCDNDSQGIVPVPAKIGDGDVPADNLYWGCGEGVRTWFKRSANWKVSVPEGKPAEPVLERFVAKHKTHAVSLVAEAYRGSAIQQCLLDFEAAVSGGKTDLVFFVGHNGLMDFALPSPTAGSGAGTEVAVICCKSREYFLGRLGAMGAVPVLLTEQFMYPGAFLVHDAIEAWAAGGGAKEIRAAAGKAYAKNQKISVKAATGVFSDLAVSTESP